MKKFVRNLGLVSMMLGFAVRTGARAQEPETTQPEEPKKERMQQELEAANQRVADAQAKVDIAKQ